ncbi:chemotaxis protein CheW [Burkholderia glumae]|uniref:Chemotaxis protein CheW n=1 Tax=Burkholderia glumae TaxID=337 RepID=A0AAP9XYZ0_BURGL|nr:chemotaxis protein CheW [Burkholderia glumae]ACR32038.1 CheW domain-containing protein [Burkholderia glumae BGR1]AJY63574.1 cheW-like domain protein [Burkholderia glumae LMG 2196 = ATCC 33617]PNL05693.1 chemotaxis protein CheW [Burkholderia glumae]QPQ91356.1 chemotaxis protein CheW [Burkholderia glumae]QQM94927.1 chemotaxis protein CheW [Burkholderia glumae]
MLFLLFELDGVRYALDVADVAEVLPLAGTKPIPGAPDWVAGILIHRGEPVLVLDVTRLALGRASARIRSTRLVIVRVRLPLATDAEPAQADDERRLGLIVEHGTQTARFERAAFRDGGIDTPHARWLGPVAHDAHGVVQWVTVRHLLGPEARALLFAAARQARPEPAGGQA